MKKLILISAIAATTLFAEGLADAAQKAAVDHATKEATKAVSGEVAKVTGTTETKSEATEAEKKDVNSTEKAEAPASLKDQAIDAAAGQVKEKTGIDKSIAKEAIKSAI